MKSLLKHLLLLSMLVTLLPLLSGCVLCDWGLIDCDRDYEDEIELPPNPEEPDPGIGINPDPEFDEDEEPDQSDEDAEDNDNPNTDDPPVDQIEDYKDEFPIPYGTEDEGSVLIEDIEIDAWKLD